MRKSYPGSVNAICVVVLAGLAAPPVQAQNQDVQAPDAGAARLQALRKQVDEQTRQLDALKRALA